MGLLVGNCQGKRQAPAPFPPIPLPLPTTQHRIFPENKSKRHVRCWTGGVGARGGVERGGGLALALWRNGFVLEGEIGEKEGGAR